MKDWPAIEAVMPLWPEHALPEFDEHAREIGFEVDALDDGLVIHLVGGDLFVHPEGNEQTRIKLVAPDKVMLQMLRDYVTEEIAKTGIVPEWLGHRAIGQPDSHAMAHVVAINRLSPSYIRITLAGAQMARFGTGGLHFRLLLGPKGQGWPMADENGVTQWPGGIKLWHRPVYTVRALRQEPGRTELDFDVFVHDGGRVTDWCKSLALGSEVVLAGPAGSRPGVVAGWNGLIGDETAMPVIARLLADLPADATGQALLVVPDAMDVQPLAHPAGVKVDWLLRAQGASPLTALEQLSIPAENRFVFFAAEAREAGQARKRLSAMGLAKTEFSAAAYWTDGSGQNTED